MDHFVAYIFEPVSVLKQYFDKHVFYKYNSSFNLMMKPVTLQYV